MESCRVGQKTQLATKMRRKDKAHNALDKGGSSPIRGLLSVVGNIIDGVLEGENHGSCVEKGGDQIL